MKLDTSPQRSRLMGRVRHKDTAPELTLRRALFKAGLRYRIKPTVRLPGRPDILFEAARLVIFVDGCFWHGCPLHGTWPKVNSAFWREKILRNQERDRSVDTALASLGWKVRRVWEHELRGDFYSLVEEIVSLVRAARSGDRHP
jgi:DNA mismatch endonuclease (patch repair protein)